MKGLFDLLKDRERQNFADNSPAEYEAEPAAAEAPDAAHGFSIELKRKRRTSMLKNMLMNAGYGDLAKMLNVKEN